MRRFTTTRSLAFLAATACVVTLSACGDARAPGYGEPDAVVTDDSCPPDATRPDNPPPDVQPDTPSCTPVPEICWNGKDDDCDGAVDEGCEQCEGAPNGTSCDDGNPCTADDACKGEECIGHFVQDGVTCPGGFCYGGTCKGDLPESCDDGNACTEDIRTADGHCDNPPRPASFCDDGNPHTPDTCDPLSGCQHGDCVPSCDGQECGPDQCGGSCGTCGEYEVCDATGACVQAADAVKLEVACLDNCEVHLFIAEKVAKPYEGDTNHGVSLDGGFWVTYVTKQQACTWEMADMAGWKIKARPLVWNESTNKWEAINWYGDDWAGAPHMGNTVTVKVNGVLVQGPEDNDPKLGFEVTVSTNSEGNMVLPVTWQCPYN